MLSLRGTDGVMGVLSKWTSDTSTEWHYTMTAIALTLNKDTWSWTQVMTNFWFLMTTASKLHKTLAMKGLWYFKEHAECTIQSIFNNVISQKLYKSEPKRAGNQFICEGHTLWDLLSVVFISKLANQWNEVEEDERQERRCCIGMQQGRLPYLMLPVNYHMLF